jgi:hypothetical protein
METMRSCSAKSFGIGKLYSIIFALLPRGIFAPLACCMLQYCDNDILIGNIRPYLKKIWHADRAGGTNGDVLVVHRTDRIINARYLYHVLADG